MKPVDGLRVSVASLLENPLRTFLTLLGITISVTAVIVVVAVIRGLDRYVAETVGDLGPGTFVVTRYGIIKNRDDWLRAVRRNPELVRADAEAIRRGAVLADQVGVSRWWGGSVKSGSRTATDVGVRGVSVEIVEVHNYESAAGRGFTSYEVDHAAPVCFLGHDVAEALFERLDPLEREVRLWGRRLRVVGVGKRIGSAFGQSQDNYVLIPLALLEKIMGTRGSVTISVRARDPLLVEACADEARAILRARHRLRYDEPDDFGIVTSGSVMAVWRDLTGMIFGVALFVVSISLVVGGVVIMNIMLLSVVERTREIGIRKAVGARRRDIRLQFLLESAILCASGGASGVLLGWLGARAVASLTPLPALVPLWAPAAAVVVTSAVGVFFGLHPALRAARLDPVEALRSQTT